MKNFDNLNNKFNLTEIDSIDDNSLIVVYNDDTLNYIKASVLKNYLGADLGEDPAVKFVATLAETRSYQNEEVPIGKAEGICDFIDSNFTTTNPGGSGDVVMINNLKVTVTDAVGTTFDSLNYFVKDSSRNQYQLSTMDGSIVVIIVGSASMVSSGFEELNITEDETVFVLLTEGSLTTPVSITLSKVI